MSPVAKRTNQPPNRTNHLEVISQRTDAGSCRWGRDKGTESPAVRDSRIDCKILREEGHSKRQPRSSRSPHSAARGDGRSSSNHHALGTYREERKGCSRVPLISFRPARGQDGEGVVGSPSLGC